MGGEELRKWCLERALELPADDPIVVADGFYRFIVSGTVLVEVGDRPGAEVAFRQSGKDLCSKCGGIGWVPRFTTGVPGGRFSMDYMQCPICNAQEGGSMPA